MTATMSAEQTLSTSELVRQVNGLTYRVLDYWARNGVLAPDSNSGLGPGTRRQYGIKQVRVARLLAAVNKLGASTEVLARIARQAERQPDGWWSGVVIISAEGDLRGFDTVGGAGYIVDVVGCARPVLLQQPQLHLP